MSPILLIILILLLVGGGGWGWNAGYYNDAVFGGGLGLVLLVLILAWALGGLRF